MPQTRKTFGQHLAEAMARSQGLDIKDHGVQLLRAAMAYNGTIESPAEAALMRIRGLLHEAYRELSTIEAALARPGGQDEMDALLELVHRMRDELGVEG